MKYSVNELKSKLQNEPNYKPQFIGFFGSKSESELERSFSNFYKSTMVIKIHDGREIKFVCNEQYFMYRKALCFKDFQTLEKILNLNLKPSDYKNLGRQVNNYDDSVWSEIRYQVMLDGLKQKFTQNEKLKNFLLSTGNAILVETSPFDNIFGIKLGKFTKDKRPSNLWKNPRNWRGQNLLGFALMETRDYLKYLDSVK